MITDVLNILERSGVLLLDLLPYIVLGVVIAEILKYTPWTRFVTKAINRSPISSVVISASLGILSPLCTYGTIPIVINLYRSGVSLAPLLAFLSASSLMNPQLFLITWGGLGLEFAIIRIVNVLVFSLMLGYTLIWVEKNYKDFGVQKVHEKFKRDCSTEKDIKVFNIKGFLKGAYSQFEFVGYYIVLGVVISVALEYLLPVATLLNRGDGGEWINIIMAALVSIPVYVCGGGVIPMIDMLMDNGMSMGAAMAFLIVGPATRITALLALGSFVSKKMLGLYVVSLLVFSFVLGIVLNNLF